MYSKQSILMILKIGYIYLKLISLVKLIPESSSSNFLFFFSYVFMISLALFVLLIFLLFRLTAFLVLVQFLMLISEIVHCNNNKKRFLSGYCKWLLFLLFFFFEFFVRYYFFFWYFICFTHRNFLLSFICYKS